MQPRRGGGHRPRALGVAGLVAGAVAVVVLVDVGGQRHRAVPGQQPFDPLGAGAAGLPVRRLDDLLLILIAVTIVVSLQAVGIVLVVAMITTPAATAQLLVKRFTAMIQVAALIGVSAAIVGLYVSYSLDIASGAAIVILETMLFILALAFTSIRSRIYAARGAVKD